MNEICCVFTLLLVLLGTSCERRATYRRVTEPEVKLIMEGQEICDFLSRELIGVFDGESASLEGEISEVEAGILEVRILIPDIDSVEDLEKIEAKLKGYKMDMERCRLRVITFRKEIIYGDEVYKREERLYAPGEFGLLAPTPIAQK